MIGKDSKTVFTGFLFQIRQHLRVYPTLKQEFTILRIDNLPTIIRQNKASIVSKFQLHGKGHKAICRSAGSQYDTYSHLLHFQ